MRPVDSRRSPNVQAVIWKMLLVTKKRFRRLKDPHLTRDVYLGAKLKDGVATQPGLL